jgi:hypothetical protein
LTPTIPPTPNPTICEGCELTYEEENKNIGTDLLNEEALNSAACNDSCAGYEICETPCEATALAIDMASATKNLLVAFVKVENCINGNGCSPILYQ